MTQYKDVYVNISEGQPQKLKHAIDAGCSMTSIRLGKDDLQGKDKLALTDAQINKLKRAKEQGKGFTIKMSRKQLKHNIKVEGGFLCLLAGLAARATNGSKNCFTSVRCWCIIWVSIIWC